MRLTAAVVFPAPLGPMTRHAWCSFGKLGAVSYANADPFGGRISNPFTLTVESMCLFILTLYSKNYGDRHRSISTRHGRTDFEEAKRPAVQPHHLSLCGLANRTVWSFRPTAADSTPTTSTRGNPDGRTATSTGSNPDGRTATSTHCRATTTSQ